MKKQNDLLQKVIEAFIGSGKYPNPVVFRANHAKRMSEIDELQRQQLLQIGSDGNYKVPLAEFQRSRLWQRERRLANQLLVKLGSLYRAEPLKNGFDLELVMPDDPTITALDIDRAAYFLNEAGLLRSYPIMDQSRKSIKIWPSEEVLLYNDIDAKIAANQKALHKFRRLKGGSLFEMQTQTKFETGETPEIVAASLKKLWDHIKIDCGDTKLQFARRISFIKDKYAREAILRDIAHAQGCLMNGFYKPAAILAGGVIEELLRRFLIYKGFPPKHDQFYKYIETCKDKELIKRALINLTGGIKDFRNLVHLKEEPSKKDAINRSTAASAIHTIFTLAREF